MIIQEPWRRSNSFDYKFRSEVLAIQFGLLLDLFDDPILPLEDLYEQILHRRHVHPKRHRITVESTPSGNSVEGGGGSVERVNV